MFVGHGLDKDFRVANIFVPPNQVADTVSLWHLEGHRYLSLRFLVGCLLEASIQDETHDSIEDARAALALFRRCGWCCSVCCWAGGVGVLIAHAFVRFVW